MKSSFDTNLDIMHRMMSVNAYRRDVVSNNISNAETPNFKGSTVNFETQLKEALDSNVQKPWFSAKKTHTGHMSFHREINYRTVSPRRVLDWQTTSKNNGNNVDIDQESTAMLSSYMSYQLMTTSVRDMFSRMNSVLS